MRETDLYAPVKTFLQGQGYEVKSEVQNCDVVACRGDEPPVVVELKRALSIGLLLQGVDRQAITDAVYVAVPAVTTARSRAVLRDAVKLCRRLGLGLMTVRLEVGAVEVHCDPGPYRPRKTPRRKEALLREFQRRVGDPNTGGQTRRKIVTAYRQDALRLARQIRAEGSGRPADLRDRLAIPKASGILQKDHYGWFQRVDRGVYEISPRGVEALEMYSDTLAILPGEIVQEAAE